MLTHYGPADVQHCVDIAADPSFLHKSCHADSPQTQLIASPVLPCQRFAALKFMLRVQQDSPANVSVHTLMPS